MRRKKLLLMLTVIAVLMTSTVAIAAANYYQEKAERAAMYQRVAQAGLGGTYAISWNVVSGGGNTMTSANYQLSSTTGQTVIGSSSSASYSLHEGFWQNIVRDFQNFLPLILRQIAGG